MATKRTNKSNIRNLSSPDEAQPTTLHSSHPQEASVLDDDHSDHAYRVKKDHGEDITSSKSLTQNTYSIIYVADPRSWAFFYGIVFFLIQICLMSFALIGAFDVGSSNFFKVPVDVSIWVRISGYIILLLSVPLFGDLLDTIEKTHEGYNPVVKCQTPHATFAKWVFANSLQFAFGIVFQFVTFVFIAKSSSVRDMLLNFAGLEFITKIDDLGFSLADRGYFTESLKNASKDVKDHKRTTTKGPWFRIVATVFLVCALLAGYSVIFYYQRTGAFLCTRMEVQFGDAFWAELPFFSGVYFVDKATRMDQRLVFGDERTDGKESFFRYCQSEKSFVFLPQQNNADDECKSESWYAKSPKSESYNILKSNANEWKTQRPGENAIFYSIDHFTMNCLDCSPDTCNIPLGGSCTTDDFSNKVCVCNEGFFGNQCQFEYDQICDTIEFDHRFAPFPIQKYDFPSRLEVVTTSSDYYMLYRNKAVYSYVYPSDSESSGYMNIIAFFGRRYYFLIVDWAGLFATKTEAGSEHAALFADLTPETAPAAFVKYMNTFLADGFLGDGELVSPLFVSEPLDLGTPQEKPDPTELAWHLVTTDWYGTRLGIGASISTRLLCTRCDDATGPYCELAGSCNSETSTCDCLDGGFVGPRCEYYDPAFNIL
ncbi:unnamed protein product [Cylindrotheca closterium]|uniref:EGF-like domain-containing protein n=1 Tax=Cylindrotheca closterium TaxID=2856 RepID=A0AAD2CLD0_9STRA|nr:unnamed protein product [Cylindrotheca closterium]